MNIRFILFSKFNRNKISLLIYSVWSFYNVLMHEEYKYVLKQVLWLLAIVFDVF